jgi:ABC-type transport system involved in cytochrome c biogenesis permease subunit
MAPVESNFCEGKAKKRGARDPSPPYKEHKGAKMEYLILVAVVAMMVLYALIIVGCLKQPEW